MPIPVICACSAKLKVGDHLKGKHIKCPKCGALIPVGASEGGAPAAAPAPPAATTEAVLQQSPLSEQERDAVEEELDKDERLVWAGKPDSRAAFLRGFVITGGLGFGAVVVLVILIVVAATVGFSGTGGTIALVFLVLFILALIGGGIAFPYLNRWRMGKTFYAFTTKRALAWNCTWGGQIVRNSYEPADMAKLHRQNLTYTSSDDGVGNLIFGAKVRTRQTAQGTVNIISRYGFFLVPRAGEVEKLLRETLVDPFMDKLYE
jgi:hypothetical protein